MYKFKLYIEGELIELFKDETISLNRSVQNIKDISKVFTDFTHSFSVPASQVNNKIFKHWYNVDIVGGFEANKRTSSTIELNFLPFQPGVIQLDNVNMRNNKPFSYDITFFSNLVNLTDLFGDDVLNELDLSAFGHTFSSANVKLGLEGAGLLSGDVIYPLISPERNWLWDSADVDDIFFESALLPSTTNGIVWNELKPAIKIIKLIEAIETKYGITFSEQFFGTTDFEKIFMWCSRDKGFLQAPGVQSPVLNYAGTTSFEQQVNAGDMTDSVSTTITPEAGFETVPYTIIVTTNGIPVSFNKVGVGIAGFVLNYPPTATKFTSFQVQSNESFSFVGSVSGTGSTGVVSTNGFVYISDEIVDSALQPGQLPDMTVTDFIDGLFKMHNLTIQATGATDFNVQTLDDWYQDGNVHDITKYVDVNNHSVARPDLNRRIEFKYHEGDTILAEQFKNTNLIGYGDLEADFDYDGGVLSIEVQFENIIFERLSSQDDGVLSDTHVGKIIDDKLDPVSANPIIFYNRAITTLTTLTNGIAFIDDTGTRLEILSYNNVGPENSLEDVTTTRSLNFGAEISTWTLGIQIESLFADYWEDYVSDLYDTKRRVFKFNAFLPLSIVTILELNDILIIRDRSYIINDMNTNFTTGETKFELLNFIGVILGVEPQNVFTYDLNFDIH